MSRRRDPASPEMNVTPLVDVVLVLLIIFMVVAPQLQAGAAVEVARAKNPDAETEAQLSPVTLSLTASGELFLDRQKVPPEALQARLEGIHQATPDRKVALKADKAVRYADARRLFKACQDTGFPGVSLEVLDSKRE